MKKNYCEVTVRRPNGQIETGIHPKVRVMNPALWAQMAAQMAKAGRGECISYRNVEITIIRIVLSTRGMCEYSPVVWTGDADRADADILAECRQLLATGHDVDERDQSDADIMAKIAAARQELADAPAREERAAREAAAYDAKMAMMARVIRD